ncbi:MAG: deoxyribose-phosphate aldolase [Anaerolineales bacterium]|nr:MAG: deoxyribose-phosphate aldolase [Anaerolineales bacterium]
MQYDTATIERLVEQITQQVLTALDDSRKSVPAPSHTHDPNCPDCERQGVQHRPHLIRQAVNAGASRLSATLGVRHIDGDIARLIDHTLLKPDATQAQIAQLCHEARQYSFAAVCVNPTHVKLCADLLKGSDVAVCTVVGFPLGATPPEVKAYEAQQAIDDGATEVDMVINVGALKGGEYDLVERDIAMVTRTCHNNRALCKVIIEAALLTEQEKIKACELSKKAGADYVKTSTGFGPGGATVADVALMRRVVGSEMGIKAAGGIRSFADAKGMVDAGATRIGASAGIRIVQEAKKRP